HLGDAALDLAGKVGMRLDPVDEKDGIGLRGIAIAVDPMPCKRSGLRSLQATDLYHLHGGADLRPHRFRSDPIVMEQLLLALRRRASMTAHRRNDKGSCLKRL